MKNKLLTISILSISMLTVMAGAAISPALGKISQAFPTISSTWIRMIVTIPSIFIILIALLCTKLVKIFRKRTIVLIGVVCFVIGGVGSSLANSFWFLIATRILLGIGVGMIMPLSNALIADFYEGIEREHMMGLSAAFTNFGGIIGPICSGLLATVGWRFAFLIYLLGLPVLILNVVGLLEPPKKEGVANKKVAPQANIFLVGLYAILFMIVFTTISVNLSLFITSEKLGSSSIIGIQMAIITFCGMMEGVFLVKILQMLNKYVVMISLFIMSVGFVVLFFAHNLGTVFIAIIIIGIGSGSMNPLIFLTTSKIAKPESMTFAMSIVSSCVYLGQFLMPFVFDLIGAVFRNTSIRFGFLVIGFGTLFASIIAFVLLLSKKERQVDISESN